MSAVDAVPIETVDEILSHIEEPGDLFPSLLVSKSFKALADRHIQYRVIRCPLGLKQLWTRLSRNPSLAENVRVLEIQREEEGFPFKKLVPATVPQEFQAAARTLYGDGHPYFRLDPSLIPSLREAETLLVLALKNMVKLKSFKWEREPPYIDPRVHPFPDDIWTVLGHSKTLVEATVLDSAAEHYTQYNPENCAFLTSIHNSLIFTLSNLTIFEYETSAYLNSTEVVPVEDMFMMLTCCPNLEVLKLKFNLGRRHRAEMGLTSVNFDDLFATIHWKYLHSIQLFGVQVSPSAAIRFLTIHAAIRSLHSLGTGFIRDAESTKLDFPSRILPNIADLNVPIYLTLLILAAPTTPPRPLRKLRLSPYTNKSVPFFTEELLRVFGFHPTIDEFEIPLVQPKDLLALSRVLPGTKILGFFPSMYFATEASDEWIRDLLKIPFPNLEVVTGITIFTETEPSADRDGVVSKLVSHFPRLRHIQQGKFEEGVGRPQYGDIFLRNAAGEVTWKFSTDEALPSSEQTVDTSSPC